MTSGKKLAPPYSHDAERAVLGSIMITPEVLCDVQPILGDGSAIYDPTHRALYEAMLAADAKGEPVGDMLLLSERVDLDRIGGLAELASMPEEVGHAGHAQHYARIVRSRAVARRLIAAGAFIAQSAREHAEVDTAPLVADCEAIVHKVSDDEPHANSERLGDIVSATMSDVFETMEGRGTTRKRVTTGFSGIDSMTHGLHGGELAILAARPSMGKTSLGGQMLLSAAESGARVAFFSLEVSRDQLVRNWLCQRAGVPLSTLRGGGCNPEQYEAIGAQVPALEALDVELNDTPAMSMV
ncbi:MAG: replicative DNA helicase, partial [Mycobacterium sp.]